MTLLLKQISVKMYFSVSIKAALLEIKEPNVIFDSNLFFRYTFYSLIFKFFYKQVCNLNVWVQSFELFSKNCLI